MNPAFTRRDLDAAREEQKEACALAANAWLNGARSPSVWAPTLGEAIRATPLDATPLADRIAELETYCLITARAAEAMELDLAAELATEQAANKLEVEALQAELAAEVARHLVTVGERDRWVRDRSDLMTRCGNAVRLADEAVRCSEEAVAEQIRRGNRITELLVQISHADDRARSAEKAAPTADQMVINRADYERLIASLPAGPLVVR